MNDKEIKACYNIYGKYYRVYRSESNKNNWTRFTVDKRTLKHLIQNDMTLGYDFKLYPYKFRFLYVFKWSFLSLIDKLKKFDKKLSQFFGGGYWKLIASIILVIGFLMKIGIIKIS